MARQTSVNKTTLLSGVIATGSGNAQPGHSGYKTYSAWGKTSSGSGSVTVVIEGSNNGGLSYDSTPIGTITVTLGTTYASDGFTSADRYESVRARVTAISGTDATVSAAVCA